MEAVRVRNTRLEAGLLKWLRGCDLQNKVFGLGALGGYGTLLFYGAGGI